MPEGSSYASLGTAAAAVQLDQWGIQQQQGRCYSGSFWDVPHPAPRHELFTELHTVKGMLSNRGEFTPLFNAHGVHLVPHQLAQTSAQQQQAAPGAVTPAFEEGHVEVPVLADSVKRKRRMKIKKHKVGRAAESDQLLELVICEAVLHFDLAANQHAAVLVAGKPFAARLHPSVLRRGNGNGNSVSCAGLRPCCSTSHSSGSGPAGREEGSLVLASMSFAALCS